MHGVCAGGGGGGGEREREGGGGGRKLSFAVRRCTEDFYPWT